MRSDEFAKTVMPLRMWDSVLVPIPGGCEACDGCGIVANIDGEMMPAPNWDGPVKDISPGAATVIKPGEAVQCFACEQVRSP